MQFSNSRIAELIARDKKLDSRTVEIDQRRGRDLNITRSKMEPDELQNNFEAAVLYYCFDQKDGELHSPLLTDLGGIVWRDNDRSMDRKTWTQHYECPSNEQLLRYDLPTVLDYWNSTYVWPAGIKEAFASAFYHIDSASLERIHFDESYIGVMIYNTDRRQVQYYDGSSWVRLV